MSERTEALATQFEQVNNDLISAVQSMSDEQWKKVCSGETWSVGVTAHYIATSHQPITRLVQTAASGGQMPGITPEMIDAGNAQHAQQAANCTKEETLALLRTNGATAASTVRGLSDEQLDRSAPLLGGPPTTAQQMAERVLIGHVQEHHNSIRAAVSGK